MREFINRHDNNAAYKIHDAIKRAALIKRYEASSINKRYEARNINKCYEAYNNNQRYEAHDTRNNTLSS